MALETPIANYEFSAGSLRGTQLSLYGTRLLHHGVGQMDSMALGAIAAVRVGYERDVRRMGWGAALGLLAIVLFVVAGPLSGAAAETAAEVSGNHSVAQLLRGTLLVLGAIASLLPANVTPNTALTPELAQRIVDYQTRTFFARSATTIENDQAAVNGAECQAAQCNAEDFARPACFALLSSSEMIFY